MIDEKILLSKISDLKKNMKSENGDYLSGYFSALSTIEGMVAGCPEISSAMQEKIINMILEERNRQDAKWGEQNHNAYVWASIIGEEYGEMCQAINEFGFNPTLDTEEQIYIEAIHTMASCMAMLECIERNRGNN